jgi:hypothetical protein
MTLGVKTRVGAEKNQPNPMLSIIRIAPLPRHDLLTSVPVYSDSHFSERETTIRVIWSYQASFFNSMLPFPLSSASRKDIGLHAVIHISRTRPSFFTPSPWSRSYSVRDSASCLQSLVKNASRPSPSCQ